MSIQVEQDAFFAHLYELYYHPVLAFIRKRVPSPELAEDLAQDTFLNVFKHKEHIKEQGVRMYIFTVARRLIITYYRNSDRWKDDTHVDLQEDGRFASDIAETYNAIEPVRLVLSRMSESDRSVLVQTFVYDHSQREIARERGHATRTVRNHLVRARTTFIREYRKEEIA